MKTLRIKVAIQIGGTEVKVHGEYARLGMTKETQLSELNKMIVRAVKMAEAS